jgi:hypothetical protein
MTEDYKDLFYLKDLDEYKLAEDYPDIRGWDVIDAEGRTIGSVGHLLVSKREERVVYLDVEIDKAVLQFDRDALDNPTDEGVRGFIDSDNEEHLIVPIGVATLDEERHKVLTTRVDYRAFARPLQR